MLNFRPGSKAEHLYSTEFENVDQKYKRFWTALELSHYRYYLQYDHSYVDLVSLNRLYEYDRILALTQPRNIEVKRYEF